MIFPASLENMTYFLVKYVIANQNNSGKQVTACLENKEVMMESDDEFPGSFSYELETTSALFSTIEHSLRSYLKICVWDYLL